MTVDELVSLLVLRAGNRVNQETVLRAELADAIVKCENSIFHPWFLLSGREGIETTIGEERVPLPQKYIAEYEEGSLWIVVDGQKTALSKVLIDDIQDSVEVEGMPTHYSISGDYIRLYPIPDAVYNLEMMYYKKSGGLVDENVWLKYAPHYLMYKALETFAETSRDKNLLRIASMKFSNEYHDLLSRHTEVQMTNRDISKGE